jgi:hypothetical protein
MLGDPDMGRWEHGPERRGSSEADGADDGGGNASSGLSGPTIMQSFALVAACFFFVSFFV